MVAPNGARLSKTDHPAIPLTLDEIVACARDCHAAGADGIHAHIRDADGQHLLDCARYRQLVSALKGAVPDLAVQITTEAVGRYDPATQMEVALNAGAEMVSVSIREICRADVSDVGRFFHQCRDTGIAVQHILYDRGDCELLGEVLAEDELHNPALQLLYVLGRYSENLQSTPSDLSPFVDWQASLNLTPDWAVCAFGKSEAVCLKAAAALGGKCRVGFENSLYLSDGSIAADNAEKVKDLRAILTRDEGASNQL
ncbi:3-keto-5-aminohexanoate cleavage protein [Celeribacter arenosi]